jgi:hypothetical protein
MLAKKEWRLGLVLVVLMAGLAWAEEKKAEEKKAADPNGTWSWTFTRQDGTEVTSTLKLKCADGKVSGTLTGRQGNETAIEEGTFKDGKITFTVVREFNNQKVTANYNGTLSGDVIKGQIETVTDNGNRTRDWEAKRAVVALATGTWKYTRTLDNGNTIESTLKLKQDGEKLTGTQVRTGADPVNIEEGTFKAGVVAFQITRERDGQKYVAKFSGKLEGDKIVGKTAFKTAAGEDREFEVTYEKVKE